mgnify:CR=1 FL=1
MLNENLRENKKKKFWFLSNLQINFTHERNCLKKNRKIDYVYVHAYLNIYSV